MPFCPGVPILDRRAYCHCLLQLLCGCNDSDGMPRTPVKDARKFLSTEAHRAGGAIQARGRRLLMGGNRVAVWLSSCPPAAQMPSSPAVYGSLGHTGLQ